MQTKIVETFSDQTRIALVKVENEEAKDQSYQKDELPDQESK
jgi:hypothetical protein